VRAGGGDKKKEEKEEVGVCAKNEIRTEAWLQIGCDGSGGLQVIRSRLRQPEESCKTVTTTAAFDM